MAGAAQPTAPSAARHPQWRRLHPVGPSPYSASFRNASPRRTCSKACSKAAVQQRFGLPVSNTTPLLGVVGRLVGRRVSIWWPRSDSGSDQGGGTTGHWQRCPPLRTPAARPAGTFSATDWPPYRLRRAACHLIQFFFHGPPSPEPCGLIFTAALRHATSGAAYRRSRRHGGRHQPYHPQNRQGHRFRFQHGQQRGTYHHRTPRPRLLPAAGGLGAELIANAMAQAF